MQELSLDLENLQTYFHTTEEGGVQVVRLTSEDLANFIDVLPGAFRKLYISDAELVDLGDGSSDPLTSFVLDVLPGPGPTMSGDFAEMLTAIALAAMEHPVDVVELKKWRYKADRRKPAPYADVVQFVLPHWPAPSADDRLVCVEVKSKALKKKSWSPIEQALIGSKTDQDGRLGLTLQWLREKSRRDKNTLATEQVERFLHAAKHPPAAHQYKAVAVISSKLVAEELAKERETSLPETTVIVIGVPDLKVTYTHVYATIPETAEILSQTS